MTAQQANNKTAKVVIGYYGELGYRVHLWPDNTELYTAGNHQQDSAAVCEPGDPGVMTEGEIEAACATTAQDLARELGCKFGGVEDE